MICLPSLGEKAPDFKANTTSGPIKLSSYTGKWVVLFSHPGDFTPVCTTEFLCFTKYYPEFKKRNAELLGLSIDSNASHLAWLYNILLFSGVDVPFPIIEDRDMKIANLYGMIAEPSNDTSAVRSVCIIDDKQILRTILHYPITTGRNIPEILRIIDALQTTDMGKVNTPADWLPGMPVIVPYPATFKELKERVKSCSKGCSCAEWYLCFVPDPKTKTNKYYKANSFPLNMYLGNSNNNAKNNSKSKKVKNTPPRAELDSSGYKPIDVNYCPNVNPIVVEYVFGNPQNLDTRLLDAAIYAFVEINSDGNLYVPNPTFLNQLVNMKTQKPSLKVIAAIGGWGAEGFSDAALTPTSRYNFARNVNNLIKEYNLDGVDIDWEYPGVSAAGIKSRPNDRENFTLLLTAIRDVIGNDKWLSVAGTGDRAYINNSVEIQNIAPIIDYFNLMSYDFTAGETGENARKHHANLFNSDLSLPGYSVDSMVNNLEEAGMPPEKILLGVPFYGRLGAITTKSYDELRRYYINKNGYEYKFDQQAKAPYLVKNNMFEMSYDNELSIFFKSQYVLKNCLGGIFAWTSIFDQANILANAMYEGIHSPSKLKNELENIYGKF